MRFTGQIAHENRALIHVICPLKQHISNCSQASSFLSSRFLLGQLTFIVTQNVAEGDTIDTNDIPFNIINDGTINITANK